MQVHIPVAKKHDTYMLGILLWAKDRWTFCAMIYSINIY